MLFAARWTKLLLTRNSGMADTDFKWPPAVGSEWEHINGMQRFRVEVSRPDHVEVTMLADVPRSARVGQRLTVAHPLQAWCYCRPAPDQAALPRKDRDLDGA